MDIIMLSEEQIQKIKMHLLEQVNNFPEEQRKIIKHKILSMNDEEFCAFLEENNLKYEQEENKEKQCVFCSIVDKKLKAYKIDEDNDFIAVLELNPLSKGHTLIIPKKHFELGKLDDSTLPFAEKVSKQLKTLSPKEIKLAKNEIFGHAIIEVIPIYVDEKERKQASAEELSSLQ